MKNVRYRSLVFRSPEFLFCSLPQLLATTQNDLAADNKVNSALDNPTRILYGAGPQQPRRRHQQPARGIGNGGQVLQGADTGITSRQSLVSERPVDRQPGAAGADRLHHEVQRDDDGH